MKKFSRAGKRDLAEMLRTEIVFPRNKISFCVVAKELCFTTTQVPASILAQKNFWGIRKRHKISIFPARQGQATDPAESGELQVETRF